VNDYFVLRDGAAGLFLAASQFPKNRETRTPSIAELKQVSDRLDPKFHYLLSSTCELMIMVIRACCVLAVKRKSSLSPPKKTKVNQQVGKRFIEMAIWKITKGKMSKEK
jgi:DNA topoisomerase-1